MNASDIQFLDSDTLNVSQTLLIAVAGTTGSGKTESAMRIARGVAGDNFCVIDSENKRALNKKNRYRFKHFDMQAPYSPEAYHDAIAAAMNAGFKAVVIDSFSAEWDDEGGLSDDAATNLERMSKGDPARAEKLTALAWKDPKQRHRKLMRYLRKLEIPVIFCLRAEPKIKYVKDDKGKTQVIDAGWLPIAEKLFGYDMLIYALMMPENPGVPVHLKKLEPEFEPMFPVGKQITEQSGVQLAKWASGTKAAAEISGNGASTGQSGAPALAQNPAAAPTITADQAIHLDDKCKEVGLSRKALLEEIGASVMRLTALPETLYQDALKAIESRRAQS